MKRQRRPSMTPDEARSFQYHSESNAARVADAFNACGCVAYESVFTLPRWNAQGFRIRKGEHSTRVPTIRVKVLERDEKGEPKRVMRSRSTAKLFCVHQVERSHYAAR